MRHYFLREALGRALAISSGARIEGELGADLAEDLEQVSRALRSAGRAVARNAPAALDGALQGYRSAGPGGAALGAAAGVLGQKAAKSAIANPAALELLLALLRPEVVDALLAMALGQRGAKSVSIGSLQVPVAAMTNLVQSLAEKAMATHQELRPGKGVPRYLAEATRRGCDISSSAVRAEALRSLLYGHSVR